MQRQTVKSFGQSVFSMFANLGNPSEPLLEQSMCESVHYESSYLISEVSFPLASLGINVDPLLNAGYASEGLNPITIQSCNKMHVPYI